MMINNNGFYITVLVSVGVHAFSGRPYMTASDKCAVELALQISGENPIELVHAGREESLPIIRRYAGMGTAKVTLLEVGKDTDPLPIIRDYLKEKKPHMVISGARGEGSEDSGLIPYLLSESLGLNLLPGVCKITKQDKGISAILALPRGQRQEVTIDAPTMFVASTKSIISRQSSFVRARNVNVNVLSKKPVIDIERDGWKVDKAKLNPVNLKKFTDRTTANERLAAIMGDAKGGTNIVEGVSTGQAIKKILGWFEKTKILKP